MVIGGDMISKETLAWFDRDDKSFRRGCRSMKDRNETMRVLREQGLTYTEIGKRIGLSRARVRNILIKLL